MNGINGEDKLRLNKSKGGDAARDLDPDVKRFVDSISGAYGRYPGFATMSYPERRRVIEEIRAPWATGGPAMARTTEVTAPSRHGPVRLRIHDPKGEGALPALIYIHGGGWTVFSLDTHDRLMREYAARAEVIVVGVDYALSPEVKYPVALEQIVDATRWLKDNGAEWNIDTARLAMGGDSAGANLTVATALTLRDAGEGDVISAMVLNYGAFDVETSEESRSRFGGPGYMLGSDEMDVFWDNYLRDDRDRADPLVCPLRARLEGLPPAFLVIPECDLLTEQSLIMAERLHAAGVSADARVYEGATHSFLEAVSIAEVADRAFADTADWLKKVMARSR